MIYLRQLRIDGDDGDCLRTALACITEVPYADVVDVLDGKEPEETWFDRLFDWCLSHGWDVDVYADGDGIPEGIAIAVGLTIRHETQTHAIVVRDGRPLWDPHPDDDFILFPARYFIRIWRP